MDRNLDYKDYTPGMKKRKKRSKPYWDDKVAKLWKNARDDERTYLSCNGSTTVKRTLRLKFVHSRGRFDKALRRAQRQYNARQQNYISALRTDNPREFWREIDKLSPDPSPPPSGVMRDDGSIATDPDEVLNRWNKIFKDCMTLTIPQCRTPSSWRASSSCPDSGKRSMMTSYGEEPRTMITRMIRMMYVTYSRHLKCWTAQLRCRKQWILFVVRVMVKR